MDLFGTFHPVYEYYYLNLYPKQDYVNNFSPFTAEQQTFARSAVNQVASFTNALFNEVSEYNSYFEYGDVHATLRFAQTGDAATASGYLPDEAYYAGDMWFRTGKYNQPGVGNYMYHTLMHELGHALGLRHGHETSNPFGALPSNIDSPEFTVMTYRSYIGSGVNQYVVESVGYPQTFMMLDVAALQYMYGANFGTNAGNTVYSFSETTGEMFVNGVGQGAPVANRIFRTIWDGNGYDTYDLSNYVSDVDIDLRPGEWSTFNQSQLSGLSGTNRSQIARGNVANAMLYQGDERSLVEHAKGGFGNDAITGNKAYNILSGLDGDDRLYGLDGDDTLLGGAGDDVLIGGNDKDRLDGGDGFDTADYSGSAYGVELYLSGGVRMGGDASGDQLVSIENIIGSAFKDLLYINNNVADRAEGGDGDDDYYVDGAGDIVVETNMDMVTGGLDRVFFMAAGGTYNLTLRVEQLWLIGNGPTNGIGNALDNLIKGNAGNNILDGQLGNDTMVGGLGDDTYIVDAINDVVDEITNGGGFDLVKASVSYMLGLNQEVLKLTGSDMIDGFGADDANILMGNSNSNVLGGGGGDDRLSGGLGADFLIGGGGGDVFAFQRLRDSRLASEKRDVISDFVKGEDRIDVSAIDAIKGGTDNAFGWIGKASADSPVGTGKIAFHWNDSPGTIADRTVVRLNADTDAKIEMVFEIAGLHMLDAGDFIL